MENIRLSDLVKQQPLVTAFLNDKHIDYCCGGDRMLFDAMAELEVGRETFLDELEQFLKNSAGQMKATIPEELYDYSIAQLIDHLEATHHRDERMLLEEVDAKVNKILLAHYAHHKDELLEVHALFSDLKKELLEHFAREEREVFPLMKQPASKESLDKVETLEAEHLGAGAIIKQLQAATHDFTAPADGCPTYIAAYDLLRKLTEDIFIHIFKENAILFPKFEKEAN
ncbi:MAG: protein of unknown function ScdA domain protein [Proteobacteria bacterium]|nr:protein of unknown function ScdA domain protein [Pseudomonadota bacterium]